jgi:lipoprotein-releasing system permease protein
MLSRPPSMSGAILRGIDPASNPTVSAVADSMREGTLEDLKPGSNRIILGRMLAYQLQVGVGDSVTVMIPSGGSAGGRRIGAAPARVPGRRDVRGRAAGARQRVLALINLQDAEALRGLAGPTGIRLKFDDVLNAPAARALAMRGLRRHPASAGARLDAGERGLLSARSASRRP